MTLTLDRSTEPLRLFKSCTKNIAGAVIDHVCGRPAKAELVSPNGSKAPRCERCGRAAEDTLNADHRLDTDVQRWKSYRVVWDEGGAS